MLVLSGALTITDGSNIHLSRLSPLLRASVRLTLCLAAFHSMLRNPSSILQGGAIFALGCVITVTGRSTISNSTASSVSG